jgi:hypothetical protein
MTAPEQRVMWNAVLRQEMSTRLRLYVWLLSRVRMFSFRFIYISVAIGVVWSFDANTGRGAAAGRAGV